MNNIEKLFIAKQAVDAPYAGMPGGGASNAGTPGARQAQAQSNGLGAVGAAGGAVAGLGGTSPALGTGAMAGGSAGLMSQRPVVQDVMSTTPQAQHGVVGAGGGGGNAYADMARRTGGMFSAMTPEQKSQAMGASGGFFGGGGMGKGLAGIGRAGAGIIQGAGSMFQGMAPTEAQRAGASHQPSMFAGFGRAGAKALNTINPYMKNIGKAFSGIGRAGSAALKGMTGGMTGATEAQRAGATHQSDSDYIQSVRDEFDKRTNSPEHQSAIQAQNTPGTPEYNALQQKINTENKFKQQSQWGRFMTPRMLRGAFNR